jgi:hypothetical protein
VTSARAALGEETFNTTPQAEGRALTIEQAIEWALTQT